MLAAVQSSGLQLPITSLNEELSKEEILLLERR